MARFTRFSLDSVSSSTVLKSKIPIARRLRLPVLGLGDLLQEEGSPGGRPQKSISHLL